jgi:hypothetical protein
MAGQCSLGMCNMGFKNCDGNDMNGCEVNTGNDPSNCGACGNVCVVPHATAGCVMGQCTVSMCDTGWTDCNGIVSDGCEVDLMSDPMNCAGCGNVCPCGPTCLMGECHVCCDAGTANCPGDPPASCATDLQNDPNNCGSCGNICGSVSCVMGVCAFDGGDGG